MAQTTMVCLAIRLVLFNLGPPSSTAPTISQEIPNLVIGDTSMSREITGVILVGKTLQ